MRAQGVVLTALKASRREECSFLLFVPGSMKHQLSLVLSCMQIATSAKSVLVMNAAAAMRLSPASELPLSDERWAPTRMIGMGVLASMNESAAAV